MSVSDNGSSDPRTRRIQEYEAILRYLARKKMARVGVSPRSGRGSNDVVQSTLAEALATSVGDPLWSEDADLDDEQMRNMLLQALFPILDRKIYKYFRRADRVLPASGSEDTADDFLNGVADDGEGHDILFQEAVEELLARLPEGELRTIAELRLEDHSVEEIADTLETSESTIHRKRHRIWRYIK